MPVSLLRICGGLLCLAFPAIAAAAQSDAIDDYVRAEMDRRHIPGLSLAVVRNGTVVKLGHYGLADVELNVPVTDDTQVRNCVDDQTVYGCGHLASGRGGETRAR